MERYRNMESLIEKYLEGETSLAEEKELKAYFASEDVAPGHEEYQSLFGFFAQERQKTYPLREQKKSPKRKYAWWSIAASIAIIVGIFLFKPASPQDLGAIEDPELAMQKTKEVLHLIAQQMNTGKEGLVYLTEIDNTKDELITNDLNLRK